MTRLARHQLSIVITLAILVAFQASCLGESGRGSRNEVSIIAEAASPDGRSIARYFTESGGGAAGHVIHFVNLQPESESFSDKGGVVFVMTGSKVTKLDWSQARLKIRYEKGGTVLQPPPELMKEMPIDFIEYSEVTPRNANRSTYPGSQD